MQGDLIGSMLGQYRIEALIGKGGMASVYRAFQSSLERYVAIKLLPAYFAHDSDFSQRFRREARAVAQLEQPNILPIYDFGEQNGLPYIVMPLVVGGTVRDRIGGTLTLDWTLQVCTQVAQALGYAHARGIIHRDVKPSNILLGPGDWVLLADFGIAKMVGESGLLTQQGVGIGTPEYMSPEQGHGLPVDGRTDQYALAMTLFEMLTGVVPFKGETPIATILKQINAPVPSICAYIPSVSPAVDEVIQRALAKQPDDRFSDVAAFATALRQAATPSIRSPDSGAAIGRESPTPLPIESRAESPPTAQQIGVAELDHALAATGPDHGAATSARLPLTDGSMSNRTTFRVGTRARTPIWQVQVPTIAAAVGLVVIIGAALLLMRPTQPPLPSDPDRSTSAPVIVASTPEAAIAVTPEPTSLPIECQDPAARIALADDALATGSVDGGRQAFAVLAACPNADTRLVASRLAGAERLAGAQAATQAGNWDGALSSLRELSASEPVFPGLASLLFQALMGAGQRALDDGSLDLASTYCGEALAIRPVDSAASRCVTGAIPPTSTPEPTPTTPPVATRAPQPTVRPTVQPAPPVAPQVQPPLAVPQAQPSATLRPPPVAVPTATLRPPPI